MTDEIWVVDDDRSIRFVLAAALRDVGHRVREFGEARTLLATLATMRPRLTVTDVRMPGLSGLELLDELHRLDQGPVIVMSAFTDVATTAAAYRAGAVDYLAKPFDLDQAVAAVARALHDASQQEPVVNAAPLVAPHVLLGESQAMREVFRLIGRVAASDLNVLITGETGTGKELVARALHEESRRHEHPFVALNTAAIPGELLESELFGHEAGAFTGASRRVLGRFEQAEAGTLFLDEIGDMPLLLQTRLLRVLAGGEFYRVGGRELLRGRARIVAATHQDLDALVLAGRFRADLRHRLDVIRIALPSLRQRRSDIPLLASHFLAAASHELGLPGKQFSPEALHCISLQDFPGNVRELENLCRRLAVVSPGQWIMPADLERQEARPQADDWTVGLREWAERALSAAESDIRGRAMAAMDKALLQVALQAHDGHRQRAAAALGVGRNTLTRKLGASRTRRRPDPG
ncbi:nitrogen regulation protein NR(I) [Frateuria aurantia]